MKNLIPIAGLIAASIGSAQAAIVTFTEDPSDFVTLPISSSNLAPATSTNTGVQSGSVVYVYRSPFENINPGNGGILMVDGGYGIPGFETLAYTSIQAGGSATFNFEPSTSLEILWGSPDSYNTLSFFDGLDGTGSNLASFTGTDMGIQTFGHDAVKFLSATSFQSVVLSTSTNAFEFTDLSAPVPGPVLGAGLPGLMAGCLALLGIGRYRRRT